MDPVENHMVVDECWPKEQDPQELDCGCKKYCRCDAGWDERE